MTMVLPVAGSGCHGLPKTEQQRLAAPSFACAYLAGGGGMSINGMKQAFIHRAINYYSAVRCSNWSSS